MALGAPTNGPIDHLTGIYGDHPHLVATVRLLNLNSDLLKETDQGRLRVNTVALILICPGPTCSIGTPAPTIHCRPNTERLSLTHLLYSTFLATYPIYTHSASSAKCQPGKRHSYPSNTGLINDDCISTGVFSPQDGVPKKMTKSTSRITLELCRLRVSFTSTNNYDD